MNVLRVLFVQMASGPEVAANLAALDELLASAGPCDLAVLPEFALCRSGPEGVGEAARSAADWMPILAPLAERLDAPLVAGGLPVCDADAPPRQIFDSSLVVSPEGELLARYDKMHLFQLDEDQHTVVDETDMFTPGKMPTLFEIGSWKIGLSICYDLRFPELFRQYVPAQLMICTAAFTQQTGRAHWEILLRARAIENQCYVLGVGQCGEHPAQNIVNYGHSMCVNPWGEVVCQAGDTPVCLTVEMESELLQTTRRRIPALYGLQVASS